MNDDIERSEQQRKVEQAGVNPVLAGYDDVDLSQHIGQDELLASDQRAAEEAPDAQKKFVLRQKKLAKIRAIYNKVVDRTAPDMTFEQFAKEYLALSDPVKMQDDLASMGMTLAAGRRNRNRINNALGNLN